MHPKAELELHAASYGLLGDELQHLEIRVALAVGQLGNAHVVAGNGHQERISEEEICVGDLPDEVVADAQRQIETIEPVRRQHRQILRPHLAIVVPGLVFHVAGEEPGPCCECGCVASRSRVLLEARGAPFCARSARSRRANTSPRVSYPAASSALLPGTSPSASGDSGIDTPARFSRSCAAAEREPAATMHLIALFGFGKITAHLNGAARGLQATVRVPERPTSPERSWPRNPRDPQQVRLRGTAAAEEPLSAATLPAV